MDIKAFISGHKNIVILGVVIVVIFVFLISRIIPTVMTTLNTQNEYKTAQSTLEDKERLLEDLKAKAEQQAKESADEPIKPFFKPIEKGLDTESVIANEFGEILMLLRSNSVKARSVSYEYDPADDNFVKNATDQYSVAKLNIEMIGTYKNFEGLLKEMFKHEHFLDIGSFEIVPYEKNKRILLISMKLKLYAQKN